ncbi:hypothetical protein evm_015016 [Chilo suppressalis]|nr:hypothetical protein evm_015016 [Chilo suppressalis]
MNTQNCINCGISSARSNAIGMHLLEDEAILSLVQQWIAPLTVNQSDHLCEACWHLANDSLGMENRGAAANVGHQRVCINCGRSVLRTRSHLLSTGSVREQRIHDVIEEWILPRRIGSTRMAYLCHSCWVRADRAAPHFVSRPSTSSAPQVQDEPAPEQSRSSERITLPNYVRPIETESHCFVQGCERQERNRVPASVRQYLLNTYNYYVPINNRVCDYHLNTETWDFINRMLDNYINVFTAAHVEDMLKLKETRSSSDFSNIFNMADLSFHHWFGFSKEQFNIILNEVPQFNQMKKGPTALAAYLLKLRTGDSNERISILFNIPRRTLESYLDGEEKPVIIIDGTYCYVQKSSNYLYQKRTYSLHKYQNLVKPFLIVCADGYIVEVLGPYPATTSDAEIMQHDFNNENALLRQYFQAGDAFILDKGFKDALPLLTDCGYRTYVPDTLQAGEWQLSTLEANKTRAVTICRWIVEVVNGRFKRDFKLFRQDFFNTASKHLMKDFEVAASLINASHPPITNRADAEVILTIINERMHMENYLGNYVITNNLNRRRANFFKIEVDDGSLVNFPRLTSNEMQLISLGSYQIRQARSYYGEHIRNDGKYVIEVCRETDSDLQSALSASSTSWLLRGRIKSRHISNKTYFTYILVDSALIGREAIIGYYCNCLVGKRTVGCCCHIMSIIWYISWARYQPDLVPPAQFLDDVVILKNK